MPIDNTYSETIARLAKENTNSFNSQDRLVNQFTGERESGNIDSVIPNSNIQNIIDNLSNDSKSVHFPDVTDVKEYRKYGVEVARYNDYNYERALAQSKGEQYFNYLAQMGTTIAGIALQGTGAIPAIINGTITEINGGSADFNNALMEWGQQIQDYGKTKAPIYRENPNKTFDFGDWAWWMSNATSVASSLGLLIPGMGAGWGAGKILGLTGKLARATNIAGKATKFTKVLANTLGKGSQYSGKLFTSAFVMRNGENMMESLQTVNQVRDQVNSMDDFEYAKFLMDEPPVLKEYREEYNKTPTKNEIADFVASKAGWRNYAVDAGNVVFDILQLAPLYRGIKPTTRSLFSPSKLVSQNLKVSGKEALTKGTSFANNLAYYGLGTVGMETVTEGMEEMVNAVASNEGLYYGKYLMDNKKETGRFAKYMKDPSNWEQAFWGSMGGGVFAGGTRLIRSAQDAIYNREDPGSMAKRSADIVNRSVGLTTTFAGLKNIDEGFMPLSNDPIEPGQEEGVRDNWINDAVYNITMASAQHHNVNLLLDQLTAPEYAQELYKTNDKKTVDETLVKMREKVLQTEKSYKDYYSNIIVRDIPEYLKPLLIKEASDIQNNLDIHTKAVSEANNKISDKLVGNPVYQAIEEQFNKDYKDKPNTTFRGAITKAALQLFKRELPRLKQEAIDSGNPMMATRFENIEKAFNEQLEQVKDNPGYKELTSKYGVEESLIVDTRDKIGHELYLKGINTDLSNILTNTEEYAKDIDNTVKADSKDMAARVRDTINERLKTATGKVLKDLQTEVKLDRRKYSQYKDIVKELDKTLRSIKTKIAEEDRVFRSRLNQVKSPVETNTTTHDVTNAGESTGTTDTHVNEKDEITHPLSKGKTTVVTETENEVRSIVDEIIRNPVKKEVISTTPTDPDDNLDAYDTIEDGMATFISSLYDVPIRLNNNNIVVPDEPTLKNWDIVINKIKQGSKVTIKYDEDQSDIILSDKTHIKRDNLRNKKVGIYDSDGNLLFHVWDLSISNGVIAYNHAGVYYTAKSNWVKVFNHLLKSGKLSNELESIIKYRDGLLKELRNDDTGVSQQIEALNTLAKSELFQAIVNLNRPTKFKDVTKNDYIDAVKHIARVITKGMNPSNLQEPIVLDDLLTSINEWDTRITNDLIYANYIRNYLNDNPDSFFETRVIEKSPGAYIISNKYTTLNNTVSDNVEDLNVPILVANKAHPNSLVPINDASTVRGLNYQNTKSYDAFIPHIPMKMGIIGDKSNPNKVEYRYVPGQYSDLGMDTNSLPKDVVDYNNKLAEFILNTIDENTDVNTIFNILRHYIYIEKGKKANTYQIVNRGRYKRSGEVKTFVLEYNKEGKPILRKFAGTENLAERTKVLSTEGISKKTFEVNTDSVKALKEFGVRRNMAFTNNRLSDSPFTDLVTEKKYNNYTEFLVETGAIVTNFGAVRDTNGKLITNASAFSNMNDIGQPMRILLGMGRNNLRVNTKEEIKETTESNVTYTTVGSYANSLSKTGVTTYRDLFTLLDTLGVIFDSSIREDIPEIAKYTSSTKKITLGTRFDSEVTDNKVRLLAHESIHAVTLGKYTTEHLKRLNAINELVRKKEYNGEFNDIFTAEESNIIRNILIETNKNVEEVVTYGLTNKVYARALQSIQMENGKPLKESLAKQLLNIILDVINSIFGNTALTEVTSILEDVLLNNDETGTDAADRAEYEAMNESKRKKAEARNKKAANVSDIITTVPNALDYIRSFDKEGRAIIRDMVNNNTLNFKCK